VITLASASAVRASLLKAAGVAFEVATSGVDEAQAKDRLLAEGSTPADVAGALAEAKAVAVSKSRGGVVIGADQTLEFEGALYDKAASLAEAKARLRTLRGRTHRLHAAVVTARDGRRLWGETITSTLTMRDFSDDFLEGYVDRNTNAALWSVGCYELEGEGIQLFEHIDGDYFAILGLPLTGLLAHLREVGLVPQ
jgi:septum formation protein